MIATLSPANTSCPTLTDFSTTLPLNGDRKWVSAKDGG
jgi:hypothetical protein